MCVCGKSGEREMHEGKEERGKKTGRGRGEDRRVI